MKRFLLACAVCVAGLNAASVLAAFVDPLNAPAAASELAVRSFLTAVTRTPGGQWVAVGRRGHILRSANGRDWTQAASVPVSTDLVGVHFASASKGWAVGHGGVILATSDGGQTWVKQLDGRQAADLLVKFYEPLAAASTDADIAFGVQDAQRFLESGPSRPFLDIWFADELNGYAVGAYNLLFITADGGKTWQPQPNRMANEMGLHLSTIAPIGGELYIAGEQGLFARLNPGSGKFERIKTPYGGSFFGLAGKPGLLVLFGLQGNAFRSKDDGATWEKIDPGLKGTIAAGTVLPDGRLVLASQGGGIAVSSDDGASFTQVRPSLPTPIYAIAPGNGDSIVAVGSRGVKTESLKQGAKNGG